jgi:hypothetical protein
VKKPAQFALAAVGAYLAYRGAKKFVPAVLDAYRANRLRQEKERQSSFVSAQIIDLNRDIENLRVRAIKLKLGTLVDGAFSDLDALRFPACMDERANIRFMGVAHALDGIRQRIR